MIPRRAALVALTAVLTVVPAAADEVTDQLDIARKAYEAGELRSAVESLNFTVAKIQEQIAARLLTLLPEPLEGWQADPAQSESGGMAAMLTGTTLSRRYFRPDGAEVTLRLMADSPMLPMLSMFLSTPFLMQADKNTKIYSLKGHRGMIKHAADGQDYEITLMVGGRILIQAQGTGLQDQTAVEQYLELLDLDAIEKSLSR